MMVFGGFLLNIDSIPAYFRWFEYLSVFRYSLEAISINEFAGLEFGCSDMEARIWEAMHAGGRPVGAGLGGSEQQLQQLQQQQPPPSPCRISGDDYLKRQNYDPDRLWLDIGILFAMTVGWLALAYLGLWRIGRRGH